MHKCFKCGAEFDGKFCPECGTQWQENKHCPNCGAMLAGGAKFCNNCGYSFVGKKEPSKVGAFFKKVWLWIKRHAKVVIPTACALIVVIVVCSLIPTFILMGVNGTYYGYTFDENGKMVFNEKNFVTLSTGKWTDSDGNEGTYSRSGKNVTLKYHDQAAEDLGDMFGEEVPTEVELAATVENGLLIISNGVREEIYAKQSHEHDYGEWEVTKEPTCTVEGEQRHTCACRKVDSEKIAPTGHSLDRNHTCKKCGITTDHILNENNECTLCGHIFVNGVELRKCSDGSVPTVPDDSYWDYFEVVGFRADSGNVTIPDRYNGKPVTSIAKEAFSGCSSLTSVNIPDSVTYIGEKAFYNCSGLTSVKIGNGITHIGQGEFEGCTSLTSVTIGDGVMNIRDNTFQGCSALETISVSENNPNFASQDGILYNKNKTEFIHIPKAIKGAVTIPDGVTSIGFYAFEGCSGLTSIAIPDSVMSIGYRAFEGCTSLIQTENGVQYIDKWVFACDSSVTTVTLRSDTVGIRAEAFYKCTSLTSITIPDSMRSIADHAFMSCRGLINVKIPDSVTSIGSEAFSDCSGLTSITIPNSVTSIGEWAFAGCSGLTSITIPNSVTKIGDNAFGGCNKVESVKIPVTAISYIPTSSLKTVVITGGESIGDRAFLGCSKLTSITIGSGVTSIGDNAFWGCSKLTSIIYHGTKTQWKAIEKSDNWNYATGDFTVQCTDGKLDKNGNEID